MQIDELTTYNLLRIMKKNTKRCVDIVLLNNENKILMLQRKDSDELFPSKWCLPGGHVDDGEDLFAAACRELDEETGIYAEKLIKVGTYNFENGYTTTLFIGLESEGCFEMSKIQLSILEHQKSDWVLLSDALQLDLAGDLKDMLNELLIKPTKGQ